MEVIKKSRCKWKASQTSSTSVRWAYGPLWARYCIISAKQPGELMTLTYILKYLGCVFLQCLCSEFWASFMGSSQFVGKHIEHRCCLLHYVVRSLKRARWTLYLEPTSFTRCPECEGSILTFCEGVHCDIAEFDGQISIVLVSYCKNIVRGSPIVSGIAQWYQGGVGHHRSLQESLSLSQDSLGALKVGWSCCQSSVTRR